MFAELPEDGALEDEDEKLGVWARRKKRCRSYMMYNPYVPLVSDMHRRDPSPETQHVLSSCSGSSMSFSLLLHLPLQYEYA